MSTCFYLYNLNLHQNVILRYPLEMHMVHVNGAFIGADGTIDIAAATADPAGLAVLGIFFKVAPKKSQVCLNLKLTFVYNIYKKIIYTHIL